MHSLCMLVCAGCLFVTDYFTRTPRKLNAFRSFASVELFHFTVPDDTVVAVWNLITFKEQGGTFGDHCPDRNVTVWVSKTISFYSLRGHYRKHISGLNKKSEVSTFPTKFFFFFTKTHVDLGIQGVSLDVHQATVKPIVILACVLYIRGIKSN